MSRFPPIPPSKQTAEQAVGHRDIEVAAQEVYGNNSFSLKNEEGAFIGPFAPLLYAPTVAPSWVRVAQAVIEVPALSLREREVAVLGVLSYNQPAYALYAHSRIGQDVGLTLSQVVDAREGRLPKDLSERESAAYVFVGALVRTRGPLGDSEFEAAKSALGMDSVAALLQITGSFLYSGVVMNGANVGLPEGEVL